MLARHLLSREELVLKPGQTTTLKNVVDGDAHVFGVAAAYQDIDHATWRAVGLLTEGQVNAFNVELVRRAVSLQTLPRHDETEKQSKDKKEKKGEKWPPTVESSGRRVCSCARSTSSSRTGASSCW